MDDMQLIAAISQMMDQKLEEKVGQVIEEVLDRKLDEKLDKKFDEKLEPVYQRLDGMDRRLDGMEQRLDRVEKRLDNLEEYSRQTRVLLEDTNQKVRLLAEGQQLLFEKVQRLDKIEETLCNVKSDTEVLKDVVSWHSKDISRLKKQA